MSPTSMDRTTVSSFCQNLNTDCEQEIMGLGV
jgi:hypothetical protein